METEISQPHNQVRLVVKIEGVESIYWVRKGLGMEAVALKFKLPLEFDCRKADCGICIFSCNQDGLSPANEREREYLSALKALPNERLACQSRVFADTDIEIRTDW